MGQITVAASFTVYTLAVIAVGLYASRFARAGDGDYFLAGRSLGPWVTALSASASAESGWVTLGLVGESFEFGVGTYWVLVGCLGGYLFNWLVMSHFLRERSVELDSLTLPDLLASQYRRRATTIRVLSVAIIFLMMMLYVGAQMTAAGKAMRAIFGMPYAWGVVVGAGIVLAYSVSGGFRAVCWTDTVQAAMMAFALVVMPVLLVAKLGGPDGVTQRLREARALTASGPAVEATVDPGAAPEPGGDGRVGDRLLNPFGGGGIWAALGFVIGYVGIGLGYPGQPHILVRFMAARDRRALRGGTVIAFSWGILVYAGAVTLGLATRALYESDPGFAAHLARTAAAAGEGRWWENSLPVIAGDLLPGMLVGLVLAAILAAMASTADSQLVVAASAVAHDFVGKVWGGSLTERGRDWVSRSTVAVLGVFAVVLAATRARNIFDFVLYAWAGLGSAFAPPLIFAKFWRRATGEGAVAGMVTGLVVTVVWNSVPSLHGAIYELVPAFAASCFAVWIVSLLTAGPDGVEEAPRDHFPPAASTAARRGRVTSKR